MMISYKGLLMLINSDDDRNYNKGVKIYSGRKKAVIGREVTSDKLRVTSNKLQVTTTISRKSFPASERKRQPHRAGEANRQKKAEKIPGVFG